MTTLHVSAFRNRDGSLIVQVLNTGRQPERIGCRPEATPRRTWWTPRMISPRVRAGSATVPARALVTYVVREG